MKLPYDPKTQRAIDEFSAKENASPHFKSALNYLLDYFEIVAEKHFVDAIVEKLPVQCCHCKNDFLGEHIRCSTKEVAEKRERLLKTGEQPTSLSGYCLGN